MQAAATTNSTPPDATAGIDALAPQAEGDKADIRLTKKAVEMAKKAIERRGTPTEGLRLGVKGGGCSGVSYVIEFADKIRGRDHVFNFDGLKIVVDPKSLIYLRGSILDYEVKLMQHGFKFRNPNEKGGCGCGESFIV
jgi:iron-sulfur cluster assembly protein